MTDRYSRQILFAGVGRAGQGKISQSTVAIVGCGALGTVSAELLTRAGIGTLKLIDRDFVEESNLQRQSLYTEDDARRSLPKAVAAAAALKAINSSVAIEASVEDLTARNIRGMCGEADILIDGTDNFETRFLLNDFSIRYNLPWIYGAAVGSYGVSYAFLPGTTPCFRCLFDAPPAPGSSPTCDTAGVLGPVIHVVAGFQAAQAIRIMVGDAPSRLLLQFDLWKDEWRPVELLEGPVPSCPCCGAHRFEYLEGPDRHILTRLCGRDAVQISPGGAHRIDLDELASRLAGSGRVQGNQYLVRAWVEDYEITCFETGRAIIHGTDDFTMARSLYARYIGS